MAKKLWVVALSLALVCALVGVNRPGGAMADAPSARARHILVSTEQEADDLLAKLELATNLNEQFAELAKEYSKCPSSRKGGDLGKFGRGAMVAEFDKVVFEKRMGVVHKVKTQFGWHLVLTTERYGVDEVAISQHANDNEDL